MKLTLLITLVGFAALSVAFLYQPQSARRGRFYGIRRRVRFVMYAYVAAVLVRLMAYMLFHLDF